MRSLIAIGASLLAACGAADPPAAVPHEGSVAATLTGTQRRGADAGRSTSARAGSATLFNPDANTMVMLYYELAGLAPPIDRWVESDRRVRYAQPIDKAALRSAVRTELETATAAVRGIGAIQLSMHASLSDYDPAYGEFIVGALAPSSVVSFDAFGETVTLKFSNARNAQLWRVPQEQAQAVRDRIGPGRHVSLEALLHIEGVQPGAAGGSVLAEVLEYELRHAGSGTVVGRVRVRR